MADIAANGKVVGQKVFGAQPVIKCAVVFFVKTGSFKIYPRVACCQIRNKCVVREKMVKSLTSETVHGDTCQGSGRIGAGDIIIQGLNTDVLGKVVTTP